MGLGWVSGVAAQAYDRGRALSTRTKRVEGGGRLVVGLCFTLTLVACPGPVEMANAGPQLLSSASEAFDFSAPRPASGEVRVGAVRGIVRVGEASDSIVNIRGTRTVFAPSGAAAAAALPRLQVDFSTAHGEVAARTRQPAETPERRYEVEYFVSVPAGVSLEINQSTGAVIVRGPIGPLDVTTSVGSILITDGKGRVGARVSSGSIEARTDGMGDITMEAANGNISLAIPPSTNATVLLSTVLGSVATLGLNFTDTTSTPTRFTGTLGSGLHRIELSAVNGGVSLRGS